MGLLFHLTVLEQRGRNHLLFSLSLLQAMPLYKITTQQILSSALDLTGRIGYLSGQLMPFVISVSMLNVFFWISSPPFKRPAHKKIDNLYFSILLHHSLKPDSCLMSYRRQEIEPWNQWGGQQWNVPCFPLIITSLFLCLFIVGGGGGHSATLGLLKKIILFTQWGWTIFNGCTSISWGRFSGKGLYGNTLRPMWLVSHPLRNQRAVMPPALECVKGEPTEKKGSYGSLFSGRVNKIWLPIWARMKVLILFERFDCLSGPEVYRNELLHTFH